jgi:hypothetical protein
MTAVAALADANGITREQVVTNGVEVLGEDGQPITKTPDDIIREIAEARANISAMLTGQGVGSIPLGGVANDARADALA